MGLITRFHVFVDGKIPDGLINAERLNSEFDTIHGLVNGHIDEANIENPCKIVVSDRNYSGATKIMGAWEFNTFPTVPNASIPDAKLTSNVPLKNAANVFSAQQKFSAGIDLDLQQALKFITEKVGSLPGWDVSYVGRVLYCTGDGKFYGANASQWIQLDYLGGYSGGSIRSYSGNGIADDGDSFKFWFKTDGASPTVKIAIKGEVFPKRFYTELGQHTHVFTGISHTHAVTDSGHTHNVVMGSHAHDGDFGSQSHTHSISLTSGSTSIAHDHGVGTLVNASMSDHAHEGVQVGAGSTGSAGAHNHTISGNVASADPIHSHSLSGSSGFPSATNGVSPTDLGTKISTSTVTGISNQGTVAGGTNANAGVNGGALSSAVKLYGKTLIVKIDGTDVTNAIKTAKGWSVIGDGTGTHEFHTAGTGELDASAWKAYASGFHTIEIIESEVGYGCGLLVHIETY